MDFFSKVNLGSKGRAEDVGLDSVIVFGRFSLNLFEYLILDGMLQNPMLLVHWVAVGDLLVSHWVAQMYF